MDAQIRKLRRELEAAHEKVNTLTTQLNTNVSSLAVTLPTGPTLTDRCPVSRDSLTVAQGALFYSSAPVHQNILIRIPVHFTDE